MVTSIAARIIGLAGTLLLTRYIAPTEYGWVSAAAVSTLTAGQFMFFAFGQYVIAKKSPAEEAFQAWLLHLLMGALAAIVVILFRVPIAASLGAPEAARFIPGFVLSTMIDRGRYMAERVLVRDLRFRTVALVNTAGELTFTSTAVAMAIMGFGPWSVMDGAIARSVVTFVLFMVTAPRAEWLKLSPLRKDVVKALFGFGTPIMLSSAADRAASTWDNLLVMRLFGAKVMGAYALSYSLAETPLIYVAERMSDVLMPAFAKMEAEERPSAVVRAAGLMALVVAPLGVGLSAVAPTVVHAFFDQRWTDMAPILSMLSVMTIFQPSAWPAIAYLQVESKTRLIMFMSGVRAVLVLSLVALFGRFGGPVAACAGVGVGFAAHSVLTVIITAKNTELPAATYFAGVARPFLACVPMWLAVSGAQSIMTSHGVPTFAILAADIVIGAIVYVGAAFVIAGANVREMLRLVRRR